MSNKEIKFAPLTPCPGYRNPECDALIDPKSFRLCGDCHRRKAIAESK